MAELPDWIIAAGTALPVLTGFAVWVVTKVGHARLEQLARAREEGRAEQLRVQQAAVTAAFHRRFDEIEALVKLIPAHEHQLERHDRILEQVRDACVAGGLMMPSDTQVGRDGRGKRNPLNDPPPFLRPK